MTDLSRLISKHRKTLQEYCQLVSRRELSEKDAERLTEILSRAANNQELTLLLNEADHFMAHELGLLNGEDRDRYINQQSKLSEYLDSGQLNTTDESPSVPTNQIQPYLKLKKNRGWKFGT